MQAAHASELEGKAFTCLEGCGFCCTFQPEASQREIALLRQRLKPRPLAVVVEGGQSLLGLHNQCGACTLLERRGCQAYDLRPQHCRYFPFHVHFGTRSEVYVNMTCRGVEPGAGDLRAAFEGAVLANAKPDHWERLARGARDTYAVFERNAKGAGVWGDALAVARAAIAEPDLASRAWMERALAHAEERTTPEAILEDALEPFSAEDVTKRPFYLAPDLRWLTFDGPTRLVEMDEKGTLAPLRELPPIERYDAPRSDVRAYLAKLIERDIFVGSVYSLVDDLEYTTSVKAATWFRLVEIVADLRVREHILDALGVAPDAMASELVRFYDSTFLDSETIGAIL